MIYEVSNYPHRLAMAAIRRSKSEAALRYYRKAWRMFGKRHKATTYFGSKLHIDLMDTLDSTIFFFGMWEPNISKEMELKLRPGNVFVDIGANIGYYTLLSSKLVGNNGKVIAIEASPSTYSILQRNIRLNNLTNVETVNLAVSDKDEELTIYDGGKDNRGATSTIATWRNGNPTATVKATTLNKILSSADISKVSLVKIDVEGAEVPILRQILSTIDQYPRDIIIAVEFTPVEDFYSTWKAEPQDYEEIFDDFIRHGFEAKAVTNDYTYRYYLEWKKQQPAESIYVSPKAKMDIFFQRPPA